MHMQRKVLSELLCKMLCVYWIQVNRCWRHCLHYASLAYDSALRRHLARYDLVKLIVAEIFSSWAVIVKFLGSLDLRGKRFCTLLPARGNAFPRTPHQPPLRQVFALAPIFSRYYAGYLVSVLPTWRHGFSCCCSPFGCHCNMVDMYIHVPRMLSTE